MDSVSQSTLILSVNPHGFFRSIHIDSVGQSTWILPVNPYWFCRSIHMDSFGQSTWIMPVNPHGFCQSIHMDSAGQSTWILPVNPHWFCQSIHMDSSGQSTLILSVNPHGFFLSIHMDQCSQQLMCQNRDSKVGTHALFVKGPGFCSLCRGWLSWQLFLWLSAALQSVPGSYFHPLLYAPLTLRRKSSSFCPHGACMLCMILRKKITERFAKQQ